MGVSLRVQALLIPFAAMLAGALFCAVLLYFWRGGKEFRKNGVTTQAVVVKKYRKDRGLENFYALVSFVDLNLRRQVIEVKIASRVWRGLREGETTAITYLREQPERAEQGPKWGKALVGGVLLYMAAIGALMAVTAFVLLIRAIFSGFETTGS